MLEQPAARLPGSADEVLYAKRPLRSCRATTGCRATASRIGIGDVADQARRQGGLDRGQLRKRGRYTFNRNVPGPACKVEIGQRGHDDNKLPPISFLHQRSQTAELEFGRTVEKANK